MPANDNYDGPQESIAGNLIAHERRAGLPGPNSGRRLEDAKALTEVVAELIIKQEELHNSTAYKNISANMDQLEQDFKSSEDALASKIDANSTKHDKFYLEYVRDKPKSVGSGAFSINISTLLSLIVILGAVASSFLAVYTEIKDSSREVKHIQSDFTKMANSQREYDENQFKVIMAGIDMRMLEYKSKIQSSNAITNAELILNLKDIDNNIKAIQKTLASYDEEFPDLADEVDSLITKHGDLWLKVNKLVRNVKENATKLETYNSLLQTSTTRAQVKSVRN